MAGVYSTLYLRTKYDLVTTFIRHIEATPMTSSQPVGHITPVRRSRGIRRDIENAVAIWDYQPYAEASQPPQMSRRMVWYHVSLMYYHLRH